MANNVQIVRSYFARLGLEAEIADIYVALLTHGPQTISELSRSSGVERTRIYRQLDTLKDSNLIETQVEHKRHILKAAPISNIHILISKKEQQLHDLHTYMGLLERILTHSSVSTPTTKVQVYKGAEGIRQMFWNETKAKTPVCAILYENMQNKTNRAFFERWVQKCNDRNIVFKGIFGSHFIATQQKWYAKHQNERLKNWQARQVSDAVFPITYSTVNYDNVVAYYTWQDNEIFGLEIYNQQMADTQQRIFDMVWAQAVPTDDITGKAFSGFSE